MATAMERQSSARKRRGRSRSGLCVRLDVLLHLLERLGIGREALLRFFEKLQLLLVDVALGFAGKHLTEVVVDLLRAGGLDLNRSLHPNLDALPLRREIADGG